MPFDLRFNNRFLNNAAASFLTSGSNPPVHMIRSASHQQPQHHPMHRANFGMRPQGPFNGPQMQNYPPHPPPHHQPNQPHYKSINMNPGPHGMPKQQQPMPQQNFMSNMPHHPMPTHLPPAHINHDQDMGSQDQGSMIHSISDFVNEERQNDELINGLCCYQIFFCQLKSRFDCFRLRSPSTSFK